MISLQIRTSARSQMVNITAQVADAIRASGLSDGAVLVSVPHTTAGITINENADPDVVHDILAALERCVPWQDPTYRHLEGNSAAHVKASLVGHSAMVPVRNGRMALGTWQALYLCEFDGPRTRNVAVTILKPD